MLCLTPSRPQQKIEDFLLARVEGPPEGSPSAKVEGLSLKKVENLSPSLRKVENSSPSPVTVDENSSPPPLKTIEGSHMAKVECLPPANAGDSNLAVVESSGPSPLPAEKSSPSLQNSSLSLAMVEDSSWSPSLVTAVDSSGPSLAKVGDSNPSLQIPSLGTVDEGSTLSLEKAVHHSSPPLPKLVDSSSPVLTKAESWSPCPGTVGVEGSSGSLAMVEDSSLSRARIENASPCQEGEEGKSRVRRMGA